MACLPHAYSQTFYLPLHLRDLPGLFLNLAVFLEEFIK